MKRAFGDKTELLARKGIYPCEWFVDEHKFNYVRLPSNDDFLVSHIKKNQVMKNMSMLGVCIKKYYVKI